MTVEYGVSMGIAHVRLNRPEKRNALTLDMYERLTGAFRSANQDPSVRVIVLSAAGEKAFCAGADLVETIPVLAEGRVHVSTLMGAHMKGPEFLKPVVCAINGTCLAGGFELMLSTDIRVAAVEADFGLPEITHGFVAPGGGLSRLRQQTSYAFAMEILLTGASFSAHRMLEAGLLNRVVPRASVLPVALAYAKAIASHSPRAVRIIKDAIARFPDLTTQQAYDEEARLGQLAFESDDARAGLEAFARRRTPT